MSRITALHIALKNGTTTVTDTVSACLGRIEATANLNAYIEIYTEEAMERAAFLDEKLATAPDKIGALFGLVVSLKDLFCYENHLVTASSRILEGFVSPYSATVVERLLAADAVIIGRVNCDEFGMGSSNENSRYGAVRNPHDTTRVAGGSSGGSAVAVATETCMISLGSDTGGSVRQPAAWCGVLGFKPTYGRVSRWGLIAYASSFDVVGIFAQDRESIAAVLQVIEGSDGFDATIQDFAASLPIPQKPKRLAIFEGLLENTAIDAEIRAALHHYIKGVVADGGSVTEVPFPLLDYIIPSYYVLTTAEASTNLARYDGVRYGARSADAQSLQEVYTLSRNEGFGIEVKRRILLGTYVLSAGFYDAYYGKAQRVRRKIHDATAAILEQYDAILTPVAPHKPFHIGARIDDPIANYLADIFTVQANLCGMPALSFPIGKHADGLPIGAQLLMKKGEDEALLL